MLFVCIVTAPRNSLNQGWLFILGPEVIMKDVVWKTDSHQDDNEVNNVRRGLPAFEEGWASPEASALQLSH